MALAGAWLLAACSVGLRQPDTAKGLQTSPDFTLQDHQGRDVSLTKLVEGGRAVIVFYRGHW